MSRSIPTEREISVYLSYLLRHHPEDAALDMDRRGWVSVDEKADVLDAVIADDGKSADVTVQYYASLGGSGYQPYTAVVHIVAP